MFIVKEIKDHLMDRDVYLENCDTHRLEKTFDYNMHDNGENYEFMQVGEIYDCKIALLGRVTSSADDEGKLMRFIANESIGLFPMIKVENEGNIYYLSRRYMKNDYDGSDFYFSASRLDLVEVNGLTHYEFKNEKVFNSIYK